MRFFFFIKWNVNHKFCGHSIWCTIMHTEQKQTTKAKENDIANIFIHLVLYRNRAKKWKEFFFKSAFFGMQSFGLMSLCVTPNE